MKKINEELVKFSEQVQEEKEKREDSENEISSMLKDVVNRVKIEIEQEKKAREATEETILNLLEETCNRMNSLSI